MNVSKAIRQLLRRLAFNLSEVRTRLRSAPVDLRQAAISHICGLWQPSRCAGQQHNNPALIIHACTVLHGRAALFACEALAILGEAYFGLVRMVRCFYGPLLQSSGAMAPSGHTGSTVPYRCD